MSVVINTDSFNTQTYSEYLYKEQLPFWNLDLKKDFVKLGSFQLLQYKINSSHCKLLRYYF